MLYEVITSRNQLFKFDKYCDEVIINIETFYDDLIKSVELFKQDALKYNRIRVRILRAEKKLNNPKYENNLPHYIKDDIRNI